MRCRNIQLIDLPKHPTGAFFVLYYFHRCRSLTITLDPTNTKQSIMWNNNKGQVIIPTGGGELLCMIEDAMTNMDLIKRGQTFVVVAFRILLAEQLCKGFWRSFQPTMHTFCMFWW